MIIKQEPRDIGKCHKCGYKFLVPSEKSLFCNGRNYVGPLENYDFLFCNDCVGKMTIDELTQIKQKYDEYQYYKSLGDKEWEEWFEKNKDRINEEIKKEYNI